ncbi:MAG: hypothetical protein SFY96_03765 [Planctomycetota bacterium]|nr:hypothetical protein [Planctomycetota bacterium]
MAEILPSPVPSEALKTPSGQSHRLARVCSVADGLLACGFALWMLGYAWGKVLSRQFVHVGSYGLDQRMVEASGFDLVWVMHAFSRRYEFALGMAELVCCVLVLVPRTRGVGALMGVGISANLTLLNYEYVIGAFEIALGLMLCSFAMLLLRWGWVLGLVGFSLRPPMSPRWPTAAKIAGWLVLAGVFVWMLIPEVMMLRQQQAQQDPLLPRGRFVVERVDAPRHDVHLVPGAYLYIDDFDVGGIRHAEKRMPARHTIDPTAGIFRFHVHHDYFTFGALPIEEQLRIGDGYWDHNIVTIQGRYERDPATGVLTVETPTGHLVLRPDPLDWPERHRRLHP